MARRPPETPGLVLRGLLGDIYVRTVRLVKTLYLDFLTYGGKTIKT